MSELTMLAVFVNTVSNRTVAVASTFNDSELDVFLINS